MYRMYIFTNKLIIFKFQIKYQVTFVLIIQ